MRIHAWILIVALALPGVARSQEKAEAPKGTIEERYQALLKEYQTKYKAFWDAFEAAKTDDEKRKAVSDLKPDEFEYLPRFLALAEEDPKGKVAVDALLWVARSGQGRHLPASDKALTLLTQEHITDEGLAEVIPMLRYSRSPAGTELLRAALEKSPHREVRGLACLELAENLKYLARLVRPADDPSKEALYESRRAEILSAEYARKLKDKGSDALYREALGLFERAAAEFADIKTRRGTVGEEAARSLFEFKQLAIGKPAPEIVGKDVDGQEMKLSDHRGKVVVLDFWGDWCGPCRAMYPHERKLVDRLRDRPFALLGINSDPDRDKLKKRMAEEGNTWRYWFDGGKTGGPIASAWNIRGWPTIYVLDPKGVIRYRDVRGEALDKAVDALLAEMEKDTEPKTAK